MSVAGYGLAVVLLAAFAAPLVVAARVSRKRLLPGWAGAPARLAELILAISIAVMLSELLGAVNGFRVEALVAAALLVGGLALLAARADPAPRAHRESRSGRRGAGRRPGRDAVETWLSAGAALLVLAQWAVPTRLSLGEGMTAPDTLWYHMPFAARFVQDGSLTHLHFVEVEPLTAFYPANSELLHALGIALFDGRDVLSPFVNLGMVALALLAGWCIGIAYRAPLALLATAVALALPILWGVNAGQAGNDVTGLAFFLAAAALLALARDRPRAGFVAGLAAGLALGTKLSLIGPVLALAAAVVATAPRGARVRQAVGWVVALAATGGFWYLRNLVRAGSPLPTVGLHLGPISYTPAPRPLSEHLELPLSHYLVDAAVWRSHLLPGLSYGFSSVWWAVVALAAAGAIGAPAARGDRLRRALGLVAMTSAVIYVVTPNSAAGRPGDPWSFGLNLRYATPAVALGLALLPIWLGARRPAWRRPLAAVLTGTLLLTLLAPTGLWSYRRLEALAYAALAAAAALAVRVLRGQSRERRLGAAAAVGLVLLAGGFAVQRHYLDNRYPPGSAGAPATFEFARGLSHTRIGVLGATVHYQLYGSNLSNRVAYVGRTRPNGGFTREPSCRAWRAAVNAGRFRYLVLTPVSSPDLPAETPTAPPVETSWTTGDPAAVPIYRSGRLVTVFRIDGELDPGGCPAA